MAKSRWRSSDAPGSPFVYQPKCFRNSRAVFRVSPCSRSARRACSSAVLKRSAGAGSGRIARPASRSRAWPNSHGFPNEPRAIITPAQFVCRLIASPSAGVRIGPFPSGAPTTSRLTGAPARLRAGPATSAARLAVFKASETAVIADDLLDRTAEVDIAKVRLKQLRDHAGDGHHDRGACAVDLDA